MFKVNIIHNKVLKSTILSVSYTLPTVFNVLYILSRAIPHNLKKLHFVGIPAAYFNPDNAINKVYVSYIVRKNKSPVYCD